MCDGGRIITHAICARMIARTASEVRVWFWICTKRIIGIAIFYITVVYFKSELFWLGLFIIGKKGLKHYFIFFDQSEDYVRYYEIEWLIQRTNFKCQTKAQSIPFHSKLTVVDFACAPVYTSTRYHISAPPLHYSSERLYNRIQCIYITVLGDVPISSNTLGQRRTDAQWIPRVLLKRIKQEIERTPSAPNLPTPAAQEATTTTTKCKHTIRTQTMPAENKIRRARKQVRTNMDKLCARWSGFMARERSLACSERSRGAAMRAWRNRPYIFIDTFTDASTHSLWGIQIGACGFECIYIDWFDMDVYNIHTISRKNFFVIVK